MYILIFALLLACAEEGAGYVSPKPWNVSTTAGGLQEWIEENRP
jgi:hypothetical protein